jgi:hypothetical protein
MYCFLIILYCMLVCHCVERSERSIPGVEDQEDFEQQHAWVKGKSLLHSLLSYYNMHFNYTAFTFCLH